MDNSENKKINNLKNFENKKNNLINFDMDINKILIKKMYIQINRYVKHKASRKAFAYYIDKLGDDKAKLKKFNVQLANLSNTVNTLPKLFKSFTSKKDQKKLKKLWQ